MKILRKTILSAFLIVIALFGTTVVGASSVVEVDDDTITVETGATAEDVGMSDLTTSSDSYVTRAELSGYTNYIDFWTYDNYMYIYVFNGSASQGATFHVRTGSSGDGVLVYDLGQIALSDGYYKLTFKVDGDYRVGILFNDDWGTQFTNLPVHIASVKVVPSIIDDAISGVTSAVIGFIALLKVLFSDTGVISIFYSSVNGLTLGGALLVIGIALSLAMFGLRYVKNLIAMRI